MVWEDRVDFIVSIVLVVEIVEGVGLPVAGAIWVGWGSLLLNLYGANSDHRGNNSNNELHYKANFNIIMY